MLAHALGVGCSKRAELVIAYAYKRDRDSLLKIANRLSSNGETSAVQLALRLLGLSVEDAVSLVALTLAEVGLGGSN